jgi:hypothetical protein
MSMVAVHLHDLSWLFEKGSRHHSYYFSWLSSLYPSSAILVRFWYHDGKHIVPVTVQIWDCLYSLLDDHVQERVNNGSIGTINISRFRCSGSSGLNNTSLLDPSWF